MSNQLLQITSCHLPPSVFYRALCARAINKKNRHSCERNDGFLISSFSNSITYPNPMTHGPVKQLQLLVPNARTTHLNLTNGRFSDLLPTSRPLPFRYPVSGINVFRICNHRLQRTLTAARPSRNLTAFPFGYLKAIRFETNS